MDVFSYNFKDRLISAFAEPLCRRILYGVRRKLQTWEDSLMSEEDSGLNNLWDEICVQVQRELSIYWDDYVDVIDSCIERQASKLKPHELMAIWWQNDNLEDEIPSSSIKETGEFGEPLDLEDDSYLMEEVVTFIRDNYVLNDAAYYRNIAIRKYLFPTW